jgi:hypothetical protein
MDGIWTVTSREAPDVVTTKGECGGVARMAAYTGRGKTGLKP